MDIVVNEGYMEELDNIELLMFDGGTFWGVVNGVFTVIGGAAGVVGGTALLMTPEPTGLTKAAGIAAIGGGGAGIVGGIATIANNI